MKHLQIFEEFIDDDKDFDPEEKADYKKRVMNLIDKNFDSLSSTDIMKILEILQQGYPIH